MLFNYDFSFQLWRHLLCFLICIELLRNRVPFWLLFFEWVLYFLSKAFRIVSLFMVLWNFMGVFWMDFSSFILLATQWSLFAYKYMLSSSRKFSCIVYLIEVSSLPFSLFFLSGTSHREQGNHYPRGSMTGKFCLIATSSAVPYNGIFLMRSFWYCT